MKRLIFIATFIFIQSLGLASAAETNDKISVVGKAIMKTVPENFVINIPVSVKDSVYENCYQVLNSRLAKLQKQLEDAGVKKEVLITGNYSIRENYEFRSGQRFLNGYLGSSSIQVTDLYTPKMIGRIFKVLNSNEAVYSINFTLSEKQKEKLNELAIREAISDAKSKAGIIASESGTKLIRISKIVYDYSGFGNDVLIRGASMAQEMIGKGSGSVTFNPKEISVEKKVQIEWIIETANK